MKKWNSQTQYYIKLKEEKEGDAGEAEEIFQVWTALLSKPCTEEEEERH